MQHVLPRGFQKIRYYGFMSHNNKLQLENVRWLALSYLGWCYRLAAAAPPDSTAAGSPTCRYCDGDMELIAIINPDGRVILGNPAARIARGPP